MKKTITDKGLDGFIEKMRRKLNSKQEKNNDSWVICDIDYLENKLFEEINEYLEDSRHGRKSEELIDIANVCMMLHHRHLDLWTKQLN